MQVMNFLPIVPLSKAPCRLEKDCLYCKINDCISLKAHLFQVNIYGYTESVSVNVPTCGNCHKELISIEAEYAELLVVKNYLIRDEPVTGNAARQIRAIMGYTRKEWSDAINASGADWIKRIEETPAVETGYALMLLGMVALNIARMES